MGTPLKDRDTFLDQGIDMYLVCEICNDLIAQDTACRIQNEVHTCHAIYCEECLLDYLADNNTCPIHEDIVLFHLPREPQFVSGERNGATTLDQITDDIEASKFCHKLFNDTINLYDREQIFDSDIKEKINATLKYIGERYNHVSGLSIKAEHMAGVMDVVREMVKAHFKSQAKAGEYKAYKSKDWLPKMNKAVGWKHPIRLCLQ